MMLKSERGAALHVLESAGVQVIIDARGDEIPKIIHWGPALGLDSDIAVRDLADASAPQIASNSVDTPVPFSIIPDASRGWVGAPGVEGHRAGTGFAVQLTLQDAGVVSASDPRVQARFRADLTDEASGLAVELQLDMLTSGLIRSRAILTNTTATGSPYTVDALRLGFPVPLRAGEVLDFAGRHMREAQAQRHALTVGTHAREGRHGRTGHDASLFYAVGTEGFGFRDGEVWAVQTAWSGNHRTFVERQTNGRTILGGEEILLAGEVVLPDGEAYSTPWVYGSYGQGIDDAGHRFHAHLRARSRSRSTPRPVVLNTWEAVYFDHQPEVLFELADRAAEVGVERFVLDDGWFLGRRSKQAGLGDWQIDRAIWPDGLRPLADHVRAHGMEFGLWFEPEMINPDSEAARQHPEWIMSPAHRQPPTARYQQVLDLSNAEAYAHVRDAIVGLVRELDIAFIKWDHNRDLIDAAHPGTGRAGVHEQTLAFYRLLDELHELFPDLEIESCSSGGARADLEAMERADRIWASDCIDAHERQRIDRWVGITIPPELLGSHIGSPVAHATGRRHTLAYRATTALMSNLGIEWDLRSASANELEELRGWVALYKSLRPVLHSGRVVRSDHPDPALSIRGVVTDETSIFSAAAVATGVGAPPGSITFPGLDDDARYEVRSIAPADKTLRYNNHPIPVWWETGVTTTGAALRNAGLQLPALSPDSAVLIRVQRVSVGE